MQWISNGNKYEGIHLLPVNDVRCTLNVHNLAPGTYIAHVQTKAGICDEKFVVVRN